MLHDDSLQHSRRMSESSITKSNKLAKKYISHCYDISKDRKMFPMQ